MSAASPKIPDSKIQDKAAEKAHEPSMEEILASIRRIIADDQATKPAEAVPEPASAPAPAPDDDVLDLAEVAEPVMRPRPVPPVAAVAPPDAPPAPKPVPLELDTIDFDDIEIGFDEPEAAPPEPPAPPAPPPVRQAVPRSAPEPELELETLISPATDASVNSAFNLLAHTVLSQNARTLEDLVKDMLKPMLKAWLDDNLPVVVERLVRAEIERVSRGR